MYTSHINLKYIKKEILVVIKIVKLNKKEVVLVDKRKQKLAQVEVIVWRKGESKIKIELEHCYEAIIPGVGF